jgi:hypothetical protein
MTTKKTRKNKENFLCELCNFKCCYESEFNRHLLTAKHINTTNTTKKQHKQTPTLLTCECGKEYIHRASLYNHKKKCKYLEKQEENNDNEPSYKELLIQAMKEMSEMRKENTEMRKEMASMMPLIGNNNNNTTNNTNFNLNFFLNETCKDALNITDFIDSLKLQLEDFEYTAENGHIKGITNIFQTALSNIEENKRPMHCTDLKREVLYIKDNDEWNKDNNNEKIKETIGEITNKNICNTGRWLEKYPDHTDPNSKDFEKYMKMTSNCMGSGEETDNNKIARNIMKEVIINK